MSNKLLFDAYTQAMRQREHALIRETVPTSDAPYMWLHGRAVTEREYWRKLWNRRARLMRRIESRLFESL